MMPIYPSNQTQAATTLAAILIALYCYATSAYAETIYRSTSADGEVTYSSQPMPDARESRTIETDSLTPEQRRAAALLRQQERNAAAGADAQLQSRDEAWKQVDGEILAAQKALADAENALQNGRTPLGGERRADIGGGTRLTGSYFQRLGELEAQVAQAKARLDQAYAARNALK
ncbi:MAG: DUF4124 domain-containing protein [Gallionella sp.]|jgi:hypothetical protein|nr:DUF4124 domain-containing protein [Gallionella sp.]